MVYKAVAVLKGEPNIKGTIFFEQLNEKEAVHITGEVSGINPGHHGFHIHQYGDTTNGCISAGPHFNIDPANHHGGPESKIRHNGDLGNVIANQEGVAKIDLWDNKISLVGGHHLDVKGRSLVLHEKQDDQGLGGNEESLKTGNAGGRIACAIIGLAKSD